MKVSYAWLQSYFDAPLPSIEEVDTKLTFHAFEVDGIEGEVIDVKVLPNRAADALSHRGIAKELSALFSIPLSRDPLRVTLPEWPKTNELTISIDDPTKSARQMGALVRGVKVGPSPAWLKERLESIGQRSINNIVDLTNYVTLDMGQPLHAFDAKKISSKDGVFSIRIRESILGESLTTLSGETYALPQGTLVIADALKGDALDIAGIKGGVTSGIDEETTDLYISVANFDGPTIRKTAQALKLWTDASLRFQNRPSPELPAYGMHAMLTHLKEIAGGELIGVVDVYPRKPERMTTTITAEKVSRHLGAIYSNEDVEEVLRRLGMEYTKDADTYSVVSPFERNDIRISEDLVDEIGRVIGFDRVVPTELPSMSVTPNPSLTKVEAIRDVLLAMGFNEISTYTMQDTGDVELAHPLADDKKYMRTDLAYGHRKAIELNKTNLPLFNTVELKLFEIGAVWPKAEEKILLGITYVSTEKRGGEKQKQIFSEIQSVLGDLLGVSVKGTQAGDTLEIPLDDLLTRSVSPNFRWNLSPKMKYVPFSVYPFALRDVAVWTPKDCTSSEIESLIREMLGDLLCRIDLFDTYEKEEKISYAFRLVLQAKDRTLTDKELTEIMDKVYKSLKAKPGFEIR